MADEQAPIGLLGGTFDPIHFGHLRCGLELYEALGLAEVRFIPVRQPPHRDVPAAGPEQRLAMVSAAVEDVDGLAVDARELRREGPSYTVDTLHSFRDELGGFPLCLILGADAFAGLPGWHRWREIPDLAHIIVARRPGWSGEMPDELSELLEARRAEGPEELRREPAGRILFWTVTRLEISSTAIRRGVARGLSPRFLVPDRVCGLIGELGLYRKREGAAR